MERKIVREDARPRTQYLLVAVRLTHIRTHRDGGSMYRDNTGSNQTWIGLGVSGRRRRRGNCDQKDEKFYLYIFR